MEIGTQTGPFRVESQLGRGGMAEVFKVWHQDLHRHEAMKVLPPALTHDRSFVERFLREARTAAGLQHPNIAAIYAVSDANAPQPYFTMELVSGGDLADLIEARGRFTLDEALPILRQIAAALDYASARGLIHRDIKPANIMLDAEGAVKVVDFGIARAHEETAGTRMTQTGMIIGTPEYMSPEQAGSGAPIGARTDQYSLAIIAYEMLCGEPPFRAPSDTGIMSVLMAHVRDAPRAPLERAPGLNANANNALLKALAKNPDERFASCAEFVRALGGEVPVGAPAKSAHADGVAYGGAPVARKKFPWLPVALGLVTFAGAALIAVGLSKPESTVVVVAPTPEKSDASAMPLPDGNATADDKSADNLALSEQAATPTKAPTRAPKVANITVPSLVGKSAAQAREIIKANSLNPDVKTGFSNAFAEQQVMAQSPAPGTQVSTGANIIIRVSRGPDVAALEEEQQTKEILAEVDGWRSAWEQQNVDAYMSHYAADARIYGNKKWYSYDEYYQHERELFGQGGSITITRKAAGVDISGDTARVNFRMTFSRVGGKGDYTSRGRESFVMRKYDDRWLIEEDVFK